MSVAEDIRTRIRRFREEDRQDVYTIYEEAFGAEALRRFDRRWHWQFGKENPVTEIEPACIWVAEKGGRVVGHVASFPTRLKVLDRQVVAHLECDLAFAEDTRTTDPTGVVTLLRRQVLNPDIEALVGLSYSDEHGQLRLAMRQHEARIVPTYHRPYRAGPIMRYMARAERVGRLGRIGVWVLPAIGTLMTPALAVLNRVRSASRDRTYSVQRETEFGAEFDDLWFRVSNSFDVVPVKDSVYMKWRFLQDPEYEHTVLCARDREGKLVGYVAVRCAMNEGMKVGRIMDVFCRPEARDLVASLLAAGLEALEQDRVDTVCCVGLHPAIRSVVQEKLYLTADSMNEPAFLSWRGDPELAEVFYNEQSWHLGHADGDNGFRP